MPAVAGLRTALACAAALRREPAAPERLRAIADAAASAPARGDGRWLSEAEAKALLRAHGLAVPDGRVVAGAEDAVRAAEALGGAVALKASSPALRHKSEIGALALGVRGADAVRAAFGRVAAAGAASCRSRRWPSRRRAGRRRAARRRRAGAGRRARRHLDELLDDVAVVPLPASPERARSRCARSAARAC